MNKADDSIIELKDPKSKFIIFALAALLLSNVVNSNILKSGDEKKSALTNKGSLPKKTGYLMKTCKLGLPPSLLRP